MVLHANHAREIDAAVRELARRDLPLFDQAVLLRGINHSTDALIELGYLVPRLTREIPGAPAKSPVAVTVAAAAG